MSHDQREHNLCCGARAAPASGSPGGAAGPGTAGGEGARVSPAGPHSRGALGPAEGTGGSGG